MSPTNGSPGDELLPADVVEADELAARSVGEEKSCKRLRLAGGAVHHGNQLMSETKLGSMSGVIMNLYKSWLK